MQPDGSKRAYVHVSGWERHTLWIEQRGEKPSSVSWVNVAGLIPSNPGSPGVNSCPQSSSAVTQTVSTSTIAVRLPSRG
jgi:hypothetical protein